MLATIWTQRADVLRRTPTAGRDRYNTPLSVEATVLRGLVCRLERYESRTVGFPRDTPAGATTTPLWRVHFRDAVPSLAFGDVLLIGGLRHRVLMVERAGGLLRAATAAFTTTEGDA